MFLGLLLVVCFVFSFGVLGLFLLGSVFVGLCCLVVDLLVFAFLLEMVVFRRFSFAVNFVYTIDGF